MNLNQERERLVIISACTKKILFYYFSNPIPCRVGGRLFKTYNLSFTLIFMCKLLFVSCLWNLVYIFSKTLLCFENEKHFSRQIATISKTQQEISFPTVSHLVLFGILHVYMSSIVDSIDLKSLMHSRILFRFFLLIPFF